MFRQAGREERKAQDGAPCPACVLHMHPKDVIAYDDPQGTIYLHWQCAELLSRQADGGDIPEEIPAAAGDEQ